MELNWNFLGGGEVQNMGGSMDISGTAHNFYF